MGRVQAQDNQNHLYLLDGLLPSMRELEAAWPRCPQALDLSRPDFSSREQGLATTLTARVRLRCYNERTHVDMFRAPTDALSWPMETWVLGYPNTRDSVFAEWFAEAPQSTDYRIIINRSARLPTHDGRWREPRTLWSTMYAYALGAKRIQLHPRKMPRTLRASTRSALAELLHCHAKGSDAVDAFFASCGHPYWHDRFPPST